MLSVLSFTRTCLGLNVIYMLNVVKKIPAPPIQKEKNETFYVNTEVTFKPLSGKEISQYVKVINPLDKAGAYAAQDHGELIIEKYSGSFTNVVGLPMSEVKEALAHSFNTFPAT